MPKKPTQPYEVGYGKPPKRTQFAKGQLGNPKGRPRKLRTASVESDIERVFNETCGTTQVQGKEKAIDGREAMYRGLALAALKLNVKAADSLLKERRTLMLALAQAIGSKAQNPGPRGGILIVPRILPLDEWEALAVASQEKLYRETWSEPMSGSAP